MYLWPWDLLQLSLSQGLAVLYLEPSSQRGLCSLISECSSSKQLLWKSRDKPGWHCAGVTPRHSVPRLGQHSCLVFHLATRLHCTASCCTSRCCTTMHAACLASPVWPHSPPTQQLTATGSCRCCPEQLLPALLSILSRKAVETDRDGWEESLNQRRGYF